MMIFNGWNLDLREPVNIAGLAPRQKSLMLRGCSGAKTIKQR